VLTGSLDIALIFIGATDHRPISATLVLSHPGLGDACLRQHPIDTNPQHFCYPAWETHQTLDLFAARVDDLLSDLDAQDSEVEDDASFTSLYHTLSHALLSAASSTFQLPKPSQPPTCLCSHTIRLIV
jgi:hypothetical protein